MWFLYKEDLCGRPRYIKATGPKVELTSNIAEAFLFDIPGIRVLLIAGKIALKDNWDTISYSNGQVERLTHAFMIENEAAYTTVRSGRPFITISDVVRDDNTNYTFCRTAGGEHDG